jgi:biotin carboxylase
MVLLSPRTYRLPAFTAAAERLGVELVQVIDTPRPLAEQWQMELGLDFSRPDEAVAAIVAYGQKRPLQAILAVDDSGALLAARASARLGLPHNDVGAAEAARNKYAMRQKLQAAGVPAPRAQRFFTDQETAELLPHITFPCVVKPTELSGSRGVIRANDAAELEAALVRLRRLLHEMAPAPQPFLVEEYVSGVEVALEGMMDNGRLSLLALFDKPDPLEGPFFEETIYLTPSRLPVAEQAAILHCTAQAAQALGLRNGPVHAELRLNECGPWLIEVAGRSIGGLCSQTLRFGEDVSLEELILRQACGLPRPDFDQDQTASGVDQVVDDMMDQVADDMMNQTASGVMMIPIPEAGLLRAVHGCDEARAVPLIEEVTITAKLNYPLVPLPEGDSYLGFIFARGETPAAVEAALRQAHARLHFQVDPLLVLTR